jgi:deoxyribodipyrimidine photo-lyase
MKKVNIFWFRRDLRIHDNAGLYAALGSNLPVLPVFIFDKIILDKLDEKKDARVEFIRNNLVFIQNELKKRGSSIEVYYGNLIDVFELLTEEYDVQTVFTNHDYEPYAIERDSLVKNFLNSKQIRFKTYKDQVIFEKDEVVKDDGKPYTIFTPFSKKWKSLLSDVNLKTYPVEERLENFLKRPAKEIPSLKSFGFRETGMKFPSKNLSEIIIENYDKTRNYPAIDGTSRLSLHLRFGTVSIRELAAKARKLNAAFLNELIWREFYMAIVWHFPRVGHNKAFKPEYDNILWRNNEDEFEKWCLGQTGFPVVDAGMRQLNETGYIHNRVRMITASFLCKDLLIDWKWGEAYFAAKLLDFDLAANNGGWQWAAGSGCDAAPYFRIFNPELQAKKFDENFDYIRKWVPEFPGPSYPKPMVDHAMAKERCLKVYKETLTQKGT